jgi:hypothetical protein
MSGVHQEAMRALLAKYRPLLDPTYHCMKSETDSTMFSDFLHHPNCLASGRVATFLTERGSGAFSKLIKDLVSLYEARADRDLIVALCSNSLVVEYSPLLLDFGFKKSQSLELLFDFYVEHDPMAWLARLSTLAEGRDIQAVLEMVVDGLGTFSDSAKEILKYIVEFTCDDYLTAPMRRARTAITKQLK